MGPREKLMLHVRVPCDEKELKLIVTRLTLNHFNGNQRLTAEALGISRRTVTNRVKQLKYKPVGG